MKFAIGILLFVVSNIVYRMYLDGGRFIIERETMLPIFIQAVFALLSFTIADMLIKQKKSL